MIEVDGIEFSYGGHKVLDGVSFRAEDRSVVSVLGPNGTGKTTLLRCMCGIHRQSAGSVRVDGTDVAGLRGRELARLVGFVPQSAPTSRVSVFDSVLLGRRPYIDWAATSRDIEIASSVIDSMGLSDLSLKYVDEISGGEFQKVQIARALAQEPAVLLLDEPTSSLDIANQHRIMGTVADLVRDRGVCTVVTMHDINLAVHYSDRLLFLKDGRVAAFGGPEIVTSDFISEVYGIEMDVVDHRGLPMVVPRDSPKYSGGRRAFLVARAMQRPIDMVEELNETSFDSFVASNSIAIIDCWAPWCGPCRRMGPIVDEAAEELSGRAAFAKLNTDENQAIAVRFQINAIPTLLVFKDGVLVQTLVGLRPKEDLVAVVESLRWISMSR